MARHKLQLVVPETAHPAVQNAVKALNTLLAIRKPTRTGDAATAGSIEAARLDDGFTVEIRQGKDHIQQIADMWQQQFGCIPPLLQTHTTLMLALRLPSGRRPTAAKTTIL